MQRAVWLPGWCCVAEMWGHADLEGADDDDDAAADESSTWRRLVSPPTAGSETAIALCEVGRGCPCRIFQTTIS